MDALPRTGIPNAFRSLNAYLSYVDTLLRTNSIPDPEAIWWDIRPHSQQQDPSLPRTEPGPNSQSKRPAPGQAALEIRVCDALPDIDDVLAVAALIQATVAWMVDLRHRNMSFRLYDRTLIAENKWRAVRYGLQGKLLDFGIEQEVPIATCCTSCSNASNPSWTASTAARRSPTFTPSCSAAPVPTSSAMSGARTAKTAGRSSISSFRRRSKAYD